MKVIVREYPRDMDYLTLYPIADVHYGAAECMEKEFTNYLQRIHDDPHAAVVLAGDLINNGIKSSVTNVYDEKYTPHQQKKDMIEMLDSIKFKIVAGCRGNHCYRTVKETSIDMMDDIFDKLGLSDNYVGDAGFIKILLGEKPKNQKQVPYMIYLAHGSGGGSLLGSGLSRQDAYQTAIEGIDISITGHTHKPVKAPAARLIFDPRNNNVIKRNTLIFVCTSWLDYDGYPTRSQMKPTAFYPDTIRLDGTEKMWN
ncbi:Calcineurin-like phosphoesterase [Sporobacter termitidis DSM 10068]|uniref:Calcineurin-like phosphoesterase n=1 Tax=Sporobacter termitidis DSM 10068 TaxID=1123282 RepID=A0A1M5ZJ49_9FIRM|nr:metallophosphoesterase [Sporobacter termitidis]SHI24355.1 Calcineurin-like phosphoesterase [Sporobacter termitidis DSM 10068]